MTREQIVGLSFSCITIGVGVYFAGFVGAVVVYAALNAWTAARIADRVDKKLDATIGSIVRGLSQ